MEEHAEHSSSDLSEGVGKKGLEEEGCRWGGVGAVPPLDGLA